jgi:poly-gamma-glutamate synthesis protein (capsule biosynthesis protein)
VDCCALANNHVLDYGGPGLIETLETLEAAGIRTAGAGRNLVQARAPAVMDVRAKGRVVVFACGTESSGIPPSWAARADRPGVDLLEDLSDRTIDRIGEMVRSVKRARDVVIVSIHWGGNWGFGVPEAHVRFGHGLIGVGVDLVHGHSSHHVRPIEVHAGKLILYGCGDFLNDYEGIAGNEEFRSDLTLMYFPTVEPATGQLVDLRMVPMQTRHFRANRASREDATWLRNAMNREGGGGCARVELDGDDLRLALRPREGRGP